MAKQRLDYIEITDATSGDLAGRPYTRVNASGINERLIAFVVMDRKEKKAYPAQAYFDLDSTLSNITNKIAFVGRPHWVDVEKTEGD